MLKTGISAHAQSICMYLLNFYYYLNFQYSYEKDVI